MKTAKILISVIGVSVIFFGSFWLYKSFSHENTDQNFLQTIESKIILQRTKIQAKMMPKNIIRRSIIAMRRVVTPSKMRRKNRNVMTMCVLQKFWKIRKIAIVVRFLTRIARLNAKI